jgi:hypothetical protein
MSKNQRRGHRLQPDPVEPKLESVETTGGFKGDKTYSHPSWGVVHASRVSGWSNLFGSNLEHQHYVTLSIGRAKKTVDSNGMERISGDMRGELIEIKMSEVQWGQLLSSMNMGSGVPCTLERVGYEYMPPAPVSEISENFHAAIKGDIETVAKDFLAAVEKIKARLQNDPRALGKGEREIMVKDLHYAVKTLTDSLPFIQKMAEERIEEQVVSAKAEIDGFLQFKAALVGFKAISDKVAALTSGEPREIEVKTLGSGTNPDTEQV